MQLGTVYLIPTVLAEDNIEAIPNYVIDAIKNCSIFFVENEKTTRRFFKKLWKEMVIDNYDWHVIHKAEDTVINNFIQLLRLGKNIGIVSEAGCPAIADPGQKLIDAAQKINATIKPLVGPSSILLALMASGMNGQCFKFNGYLPIDTFDRKKKIKELEIDSSKANCTQIFIETPYRNNQMLKDIISVCKNETKLCIATNITASEEKIVTKSIAQWLNKLPDIHKQPTIFLLLNTV
ncbi:MAG: SAM-dependent methyltransferase [Chitinophagaceae bacterium]|nr:SAM-dependent methyltransferase [Chitinophagaceae bacterium]MCW5905805.1 SAM-dependent methyltransferase [Chitinophagaceae bacterium]